MKLSTLILLVTTLQVMADNAFAQKVTIQKKNVTVLEVLRAIRQQTGYLFIGDLQTIQTAKKVSLNLQDVTIKQVLDESFQDQPLTYMIYDKTIVVKRKSESPEPPKNPNQVNHRTVPNFENEEKMMAQLSSKISMEVVQEAVIKGKVTDDKGDGLPGVSVVVKGTQLGTSTGTDGSFTLQIPQGNASLIFSFVGYLSQEIIVGNQTFLEVTLKTDEKALAEVVVVGYGTQQKKDLTGSIALVDPEKLQDLPVATIDQKLVGRIAGVQIRQGSGAPGAGSSVKIRGIGSISAGNEPLYVVDGMPYAADMNQNSNPLLYINPADIESLSVLKDASSTAIYGSRGSNGVVLITTKKGSYNRARITASSMVGFQQVPQQGRPAMMNQQQFADLQREMIALKIKLRDKRVATNEDYPLEYRFPEQMVGDGTDWYDLILRTAPIQDHNINITKGGDNSKFGFSLGYFNQQGVLAHTGMERYTARLNFESLLLPTVKIGGSLAPSFIKQNRANTNSSRGDVIGLAIWASPIAKPYDSQGKLTPYLYAPQNNYFNAWGFPNPLYVLQETKYVDKNFQNLGNAFLEWTVIPGLRLKTAISTIWDNKDYFNYNPKTVGGQNAPPLPSSTGNANISKSQSFNWLIENTADYSKVIGKHNFNALLGYTTQSFKSNGINLNAAPYTNDLIQTINAAQAIKTWNQTVNEWSMISYLGRINYTFNSKYLFTATFRSDGSSRFGSQNRFATFPSMAIAWRMSEEEWIKDLKWINDLKMRVSFGKGGNNNIGNYSSVASIQSGDYIINGSQVSGLSVGIGNPWLTWEKSNQVDFGLDAAVLNNRLTFSTDLYYRRSSDMLLENRIPATTGFTAQTVNLGSIENKGLELSIGATPLDHRLKWDVNFNISFNRNKVLSLNDDDDPIISAIDGTTSSHMTKVGLPIGQFRGYIWDGIYSAADMANPSVPKYIQAEEGAARFKDLNKDGIITDEIDFDVIGNPHSKFFFGFVNNFSYRQFDLAIVTQGDYGGSVINGLRRTTNNLEGFFNVGEEWVNRWRSADQPGDGVHHGLPSGAGRGHRPTQLWVEDSSYWRISNVTLGYTLPEGLLQKSGFISNCRFYISCQNLALLTKYSGANPEAQLNIGNSSLMSGWDTSAYPLSRTFSMGINLSF